jgi:hypothetical protein
MEETFLNIEEKIEFSKKDAFMDLVRRCIHESNEQHGKTVYSEHANVVFKVSDFFKSFPTFINEFGKDKKYRAGVHALSVIGEELGLDLDDSEYLILFHLRELGKFRKKESDLLKELKQVWPYYKDLKIEDEDFTHSLKNLMRAKFINYRKGNLTINSNIIIRYKR